MSNLSSTRLEPGFARLNHLALIRVSGADAVSFLHSQLTNDIKSLPNHHACLAGFCTAKGRLLATMLLWKSDDAITLAVPAELQENLQKRLQMYVLRAKVKLEHVSPEHTVFGILGDTCAKQLQAWFPTIPAAPYQLVTNEFGTLLRMTDAAGMARYLCVLDADQLVHGASWSPVLTESVWLLSDIHAGIPQVSAATVEKFVPQMLNYELIGGVNFKKGCYPGQEIVARTHYLGKQKRRSLLARIANPSVPAGTEVFASTDPEQPCGMVVNSAGNGAGGSDCLIEIKTSFLADATITLSSGEICEWLPMPYPIPDDAAQTS